MKSNQVLARFFGEDDDLFGICLVRKAGSGVGNSVNVFEADAEQLGHMVDKVERRIEGDEERLGFLQEPEMAIIFSERNIRRD